MVEPMNTILLEAFYKKSPGRLNKRKKKNMQSRIGSSQHISTVNTGAKNVNSLKKYGRKKKIA